jgi:hypothetical protein
MSKTDFARAFLSEAELRRPIARPRFNNGSQAPASSHLIRVGHEKSFKKERPRTAFAA